MEYPKEPGIVSSLNGIALLAFEVLSGKALVWPEINRPARFHHTDCRLVRRRTSVNRDDVNLWQLSLETKALYTQSPETSN